MYSLLLALVTGCHVHVTHDFVAANLPVELEDVELGEAIDEEYCRDFVFGIPTEAILSPADLVRELSGGEPIVGLAIETRSRRGLFSGQRCFRITGFRTRLRADGDGEGARPLAVGPLPVTAPATGPALVRPSAPATVGPARPAPVVTGSGRIVGWPSLPLGAARPEGTRGSVRPDDVGAGFEGMEVTDVVVSFKNDVAVRVTMQVPLTGAGDLSEVWGPAEVGRSGSYTWADGDVSATLVGRELRIELGAKR